METFVAGSAGAAVSRVELTLSCRDLADMDVFSKSDPFIVVYTCSEGSNTWTEFKRTEVIYDNLNPDFATKLVMNYRFEEQQRLRFDVYDTDAPLESAPTNSSRPSIYNRFDVYDIDAPSADLSKHDFLGRRDCTLGELVTGRVTSLPLVGSPRGCGSLLVHTEELLSSRQHATFRLSASNLDSKSWFWGKSSPYLELLKCTEEGRWVLVSRTEVQKRTTRPQWRQLEVPVASLCNGDHHRNIRATCWHWNSSGTPSLIGHTHFTLHQLKSGSATLALLHPQKKERKGAAYKNSGELSVGVGLREVHSFLDYIQGGTELACTIAIDFTASNGNPQMSDSLHFLGGRDHNGQLSNPYMTALRSVGSIIQDYDSDKEFPVLGFGARIPPEGLVSHEFFVNLQTSPFCHGIEGVIAAYQQCLPRIQLFGPTNFAPVIHHVAAFARQYRDGSQYFILLIITDGVITDMPQTKQAIVDASSLPLSIIIVGVGTADFSAMEELDGDVVRLSSNGRQAQRDIVQFVPLQSLLSGDRATLKSRLAREVLAEIPDQFLGFMRANRVTPGARKETVTELPPDPQLRL